MCNVCSAVFSVCNMGKYECSTVQCAVCALCSMCAVCSVQCVQYWQVCALCSVQGSAVHNVGAVFSVQCAMCSVCAVLAHCWCSMGKCVFASISAVSQQMLCTTAVNTKYTKYKHKYKQQIQIQPTNDLLNCITTKCAGSIRHSGIVAKLRAQNFR